MSDLMPGRELDLLIAKKIMGWSVVGEGTDYTTYVDQHWCEHSFSSVPHYSTDISAAWEVVEALKTKGWTLGYLSEKESDRMVCQFVGREDMQDAGAYAPTAPHAICLASLRAIGDLK